MSFSLPCQTIEAYKISNAEDYAITVMSNEVYDAGATEPVKVYSGTSQLYDSATYPMYNEAMVEENINRTFQRAHREYLNSFNTDFSNVQAVDLSFTESTGTSVSAFEIYKSFSFSDNNNYSRLAYLKVDLAYSHDGSTNDELYEFILEDAQGTPTTAVVCSKVKFSSANIASPTYTLSFEEGNVKKMCEIAPGSSPTSGTSYYIPVESFAQFYDLDQTATTGNWKLRVKCLKPAGMTGSSIAVSVKATITGYFTLKYGSGVHNIAKPALIDAVNNKLVFDFDQRSVLGVTYALSPKLYTILGFGGTYDSSLNKYRLHLPPIVFNADPYGEMEQNSSTLYKFIGIRSVSFVSNQLPVVGEYYKDATQNGIICSFSPSTDTAFDRYEYFQSSEYRFFDMDGNIAIKDIDLSVFVNYVTGESVRATIPPHEEFNCKIKFTRK
jgi:hypothetical protein